MKNYCKFHEHVKSLVEMSPFLKAKLDSRGAENHLSAFSLIEMMVVIGIAIILAGLAIPAFRTEKTAASGAYMLAGIFDRARSYAMASSTYVFVGLFEEDGSQPPLAMDAIAKKGVGRVVAATVASKDGMSGYAASNKSWAAYDNGGHLQPLGKLCRLESLSISGTRTTDTLGGMARPPMDTNSLLITGSTAAYTSFAWPLGKAMGTGCYHFQTVICFDPRGIARVLNATTPDFTSIPAYLEIGLLTAHGNTISSDSNIAALQIDAITGATRVYRP